MTLDEAREALGVTRGAGVDEIRDAFRRQARDLHPDRHPSANDERRRQLGRDFDRARRARDILVAFASNPPRPTTPASAPASATPAPSTSSTPPTSASPPTAPPPPRRERARPRTSESRPRTEAPRVTIRFDEFVRAADAAGFGPGRRTRRWIDWPRIVAWSTVGTLVALVAGVGLVGNHLL